MKKWCEYCSGSYPIFDCNITKKLASEYDYTHHCRTGGKQCQKKIDFMKTEKVSENKNSPVKKLVKSIRK